MVARRSGHADPRPCHTEPHLRDPSPVAELVPSGIELRVGRRSAAYRSAFSMRCPTTRAPTMRNRTTTGWWRARRSPRRRARRRAAPSRMAGRSCPPRRRCRQARLSPPVGRHLQRHGQRLVAHVAVADDRDSGQLAWQVAHPAPEPLWQRRLEAAHPQPATVGHRAQLDPRCPAWPPARCGTSFGRPTRSSPISTRTRKRPVLVATSFFSARRTTCRASAPEALTWALWTSPVGARRLSWSRGTVRARGQCRDDGSGKPEQAYPHRRTAFRSRPMMGLEAGSVALLGTWRPNWDRSRL